MNSWWSRTPKFFSFNTIDTESVNKMRWALKPFRIGGLILPPLLSVQSSIFYEFIHILYFNKSLLFKCLPIFTNDSFGVKSCLRRSNGIINCWIIEINDAILTNGNGCESKSVFIHWARLSSQFWWFYPRFIANISDVIVLRCMLLLYLMLDRVFSIMTIKSEEMKYLLNWSR